MSKDYSPKKVALVTESLWKMAGSNRVLDSFAEIYPDAQIFALFGEKQNLTENLRSRKIHFSFLNKFPLVKKLYRYTFAFWPVAIEHFDLSEFDLIISFSSSVAHGVITPLKSKHIAYINTPMRYAWDLHSLYRGNVRLGFFKKIVKEFFLSINRAWDVVAAQRPDLIIVNSDFVKQRIEKYWDRKVNHVVSPPHSEYKGKIVSNREDYFLAGAPFEPNKRGDFLLECASKIGFNLKIIGGGSMKKRLKRKYKRFRNIEFLDWVSEKEKYELLSRAKGFVVAGIEDYGIFCAEAISCGTPVLAYRGGGSLEIVTEGVNGVFFDDWSVEEFRESMRILQERNWNYEKVSGSSENVNSKKNFKKEIVGLLVE